MLDIRDVFSNLFGLFLLIGVGYGTVRLRVLPASASKMLSSLLMNVTMPATIFTSLVRPYDPAFLRAGLLEVVLGLALYILYGVISALLARPFRVTRERRGLWTFACAFNNNGFMGFPIALALFGEEGLALAVFLGIPFNLLAYTTGATLICMDRSASGDAPPVSWRSILLTVVNGATLLGLILYAAQIPIPEVIDMNLTGGSVSALLRNRDVLSSAFLRLLFLPLLTWWILMLLPVEDPLVIGVTLIIMAMPSPAVTSILAETYGGDTQFASEAVFLSSLLCLVTIPLISLLL